MENCHIYVPDRLHSREKRRCKIKMYAGNKKTCGIKCRWSHNNGDDTIATDKNKR